MKKTLALCTTLLILAMQIVPIAIANSNEGFETEEAPVEGSDYYFQTFIISAYYSPLPGQEKYATGSYEADIRLNGNGTNGADGTEVYPGMIAAPKKYAFGTKMNIPGVGIVAVHDRGGAIVKAGERNNAYDRLDIWMGFGDAGLKRALNWGKRTVQVTVYGIAPEIEEQVYLADYSETERFVQSVVYPSLTFPNDIYFASEGDEVTKMQEQMLEWGYLDEVSGFYGNSTSQAVFEFQLDYDIVASADELGAGHFGINTRRKFDEILQSGHSEEAIQLREGRKLLEKYSDLNDSFSEFNRALGLGDSGADVTILQEELNKLGFLRIEPTGYFGEVTEHAVFKFQQSRGIVANADDRGAGYVGPATRALFNSITKNRLDMKSLIAYKREQLEGPVRLLKMPSSQLAVREEE